MLLVMLVLLPGTTATRSNVISLIGLFGFGFFALGYGMRAAWPARHDLKGVVTRASEE